MGMNKNTKVTPPPSKSSGGGWTDAEKLQVIFSLLKANGPIPYNKAYVPPGRSVKAIMHMVQGEQKKMQALLADDETSTSNPDSPPPKPTKAKATRAPKGKTEDEAAKAGVKRKRAIKEEDSEDTAMPTKDDPEIKKLKEELEHTLGESEQMRMENLAEFSSKTEEA